MTPHENDFRKFLMAFALKWTLMYVVNEWKCHMIFVHMNDDIKIEEYSADIVHFYVHSNSNY